MGVTIFRGLQGQLLTASTFKGPALLLDNCALQQFAECQELGDQLVEVMGRSDGTLCLSGINSAEMSKGKWSKHAVAVDKLLSRLFNHLYFIDHSAALAFTGTYLEPRPAPPSDQESAAEVVIRYWEGQQANSGDGDNKGLFTLVWSSRERTAQVIREMAESVATGWLTHRSDPEYIEKVRNYVAQPHMPRVYTVTAELMRDLLLEPKANITPNDAIDLIHAVTGLTFCHFVVLDGRWARRAAIASQRLGRFTEELATPFAATEEGLNELLTALRAEGEGRSDS
jgi:hypothetical protein